MLKLYLKNGKIISVALSSNEAEYSLVCNFNKKNDLTRDLLELEFKGLLVDDIEKLVYSSIKMPAVNSLTPLILSVFEDKELMESNDKILVDRLLDGLNMTAEKI